MEVAPQPTAKGYVHADIQHALDVLDQAGDIEQQRLPMRRRELAEFYSRDVGANTDAPRAEIATDEKHDTVTITLDSRTAGVLIYAARLMMANYQAHANEVRMVARQMPQGSFGSTNRIVIADRHMRIVGRLRVVERSYQDAVDREYFGI